MSYKFGCIFTTSEPDLSHVPLQYGSLRTHQPQFLPNPREFDMKPRPVVRPRKKQRPPRPQCTSAYEPTREPARVQTLPRDRAHWEPHSDRPSAQLCHGIQSVRRHLVHREAGSGAAAKRDKGPCGILVCVPSASSPSSPGALPAPGPRQRNMCTWKSTGVCSSNNACVGSNPDRGWRARRSRT